MTDYLVKTDKPEGGVTLAAVAEEAGAAVTYSANTITTLPQDNFTITVTAENGAKKNYTTKLSDRNEDTVFAHDDFEAYTVGSNITSALWSTNNNTTNGTMGAVDPLDETNQVGKFYNLTGGTQNQQLNRYLGGINTEPVIVKGRYLNRIFLPAPFTEVIVRGNGTDGIVAAKFAANGDLVIGSSTVAGAKYAEKRMGELYFVIKPTQTATASPVISTATAPDGKRRKGGCRYGERVRQAMSKPIWRGSTPVFCTKEA